MTGRYFVDSNIWLYLFTNDDLDKKNMAKAFLDELVGTGSLFVSWQVLNEVWFNLLKKGVDRAETLAMAKHIRELSEVVDFSFDLLVRAHDLRCRHAVSFWDSLVVAAALAADCDYLLSEDMQDGKRFDGLLVRNIFV